MNPKRQHTIAVYVEGAVGVLLVLAGLTLAALALDWTLPFWLVTVGAALVGHAVTFAFGLLHRPYFWSTSRGKRPRGL